MKRKTKILMPAAAVIVAAAYLRDLRAHKKMMTEIKRRDRLLRTVNQAADILLRNETDNIDSTMYQCMGKMARAIDADHMYIFRNYNEDGRLCCKKLYEWPENASSFSKTDSGTGIAYDEKMPESGKTLSCGNCVHSLVCNMPACDQTQYGSQKVLAVLLIPVFVQKEFWGYVGFDNCHSERLFTKNEESIVRSGSLLIANALLRNEYISDIRETAVRREKALAEARNANHAKSDFLAKMSHEMRTPLNAIIGLSEVALNSIHMDAEARLNLEKINSSGSILLSIVNDILDISKIQSGKFEINPGRYDVPGMVSDAVLQNILRIGNKPIRFELDIDETMPAHLYGDELRIRQIINNLLSNAIKYTEKGKVKLGLKSEHDGNHEWITIRVSDTGVGIRPENLDLLFTDYMQFGPTSRHQADGTGLGLAITKKLVEMMDGTITVDSKFGEGSVFSVKLPQKSITKAVIGHEISQKLKNFQYSAGRRSRNEPLDRIRLPYANVLVVDDNTINLKVVKSHMKPYGMRVDCVTGGQEAIHAVREEKVKYHAIFMDHMMPEMDGIEAVQIIRQDIGTDYARNIPIIALTANAVAGSEEMFLENGFQAFISKPIDTTKLDAIINHWIRDKILLDHGIDTQKGILYSGSEALYFSLLGDFYKLIDSKAAKIEKCLADGLIRDVTIEVHALKNNARIIGAEQLAEMFHRMEQYGNDGDREALEREIPEVMERYRSCRAVLKPFGETAEEDKEEASNAKIISLLNKLRSAMSNFDLDGADEAISRLDRLQIPAECRKQMEALKAYVADVAIEEVVRITEEMIENVHDRPAFAQSAGHVQIRKL